MSRIGVFVSFNIEHDGELYERLLAESKKPTSGFAVLGGSERLAATGAWSEKARQRIRDADQVIVICSEHTGASTQASAELCIAQEEQIPYFLLWGRREFMCTKPAGAKPADGMYSWTPQILRDRITVTCRESSENSTAERVHGATRKGVIPGEPR